MKPHQTIAIIFASAALVGLGATAPALAHDEKAHEVMAKTASTPESAEIPLFDTLGVHRHLISTPVAEAQAYFDQGIRLLFNFNHRAAIRSFEAALARDAECAMCWWGIAFAYGPNINLPMMPDAAKPAFEAVRKAEALAAGARPEERAYIAAIAARYAETPPDDRKPLDEAFAREMGKLAAMYPDDPDAQVFFAEALMDVQPWDYWQADGVTPKLNAAEIVAVLERVIARWPDHPGALHLYIHAVEASASPERAEAAADRLLTLMPGAGHLVHMPSHIYYRVGRYEESRLSNVAAVKADEEFFEASGAGGVYPIVYFNHNVHFVWASAAMEGRSNDAIAAAARLSGGIPPALVEQLAIGELFVPVHDEALVQFGRWDEILAMPWPPKTQRFATAMRHYARGFAHAATDQLGKATTNLKKLDAVKGDPALGGLEGFGVPANRLVEIASALLAGEIARRQGRLDVAIARFEQAATIQDALPYTEPPYWYYPVRHTLGAVLLQAKRYAAAEKVYRESLAHHRGDGWATFGLAEALDGQGKTDEAGAARAAFNAAWSGADVRLEAGRF